MKVNAAEESEGNNGIWYSIILHIIFVIFMMFTGNHNYKIKIPIAYISVHSEHSGDDTASSGGEGSASSENEEPQEVYITKQYGKKALCKK